MCAHVFIYVCFKVWKNLRQHVIMCNWFSSLYFFCIVWIFHDKHHEKKAHWVLPERTGWRAWKTPDVLHRFNTCWVLGSSSPRPRCELISWIWATFSSLCQVHSQQKCVDMQVFRGKLGCYSIISVWGALSTPVCYCACAHLYSMDSMYHGQYLFFSFFLIFSIS